MMNIPSLQKLLIKPETYGLLILFLFLLPLALHAQSTDVKVDSGRLSIKTGFIYIPGNLNVSTKGEVHNEGIIYLDGNIVNQKGPLFITSSILFLSDTSKAGNKDKTIGEVIFKGSARQHVKSLNNNIMFSTLTVNNPNELHLDTSIFTFDAIRLPGGSIRLNSHNISTFIEGKTPLSGGHISKESTTNRIYDTTSIDDYLVGKRGGYVKGSFLGNSLSLKPDSLGIHLGEYSNIYIDRGHISLPYAGDGSIRKYYIITKKEKGTINSYISISYLDSADFEKLKIKEPDFRMFLKGNPKDNNTNNSPVEYTNMGGAIDAASNKATLMGIENNNVKDTSIWTVADQICKNPPIFKFATPALNVCSRMPFTLEDKDIINPPSQSVYYKWYIKNVNDSLTAITEGKYTDTLSTIAQRTYKVKKYDTRGCFSFDSITVTNRPLPIDSFKRIFPFYCKGTSITFADSSTISDLSPLTYSWAFGDEQTSTAKSILHTYTGALLYKGYLAVRSIYGCADTAKFTIDIKPVPVVDFTAKQNCNSTAVHFSNTSFVEKKGSFKKAVWSFTSADSLILSNYSGSDPLSATFNYPTTGNQTVRLTMTSSFNCSAYLDKPVTINAPINASFNAGDVCIGTDVSFQNTSIPGNSPAYLWNFGDSTTSAVASPAKGYTYPGIFDIKLKVTSGSCSDSVTHKVYVNPNPDANFTVSNACLGQQISFIPMVANQGQYQWDIDGEAFTVQQPVMTFTKAGTFNALLTVVTNSGCTKTYTRNFEVYPLPAANFAFANACFGAPINFYNQSAVQGGSLTCLWDFGDDITSVNTSPTHLFGDSARTWPVKLVAISNLGCRDSVTKIAETYPLPTAGLPSERSTCGNSMTLNAQVTSPKYTVASYSWSNGVKSPVNVVSNNLTYSVTLITTSVTLITTNGCTATESIKVTLNSKVDPMLPDAIPFCGSGKLDALYPDNNCIWSTGEQQRIITITETGWYKVDIMDENNCTARDSSYVTIHPAPLLELGTDISACTGNKVYLDAGNGFVTYQWSTRETVSKIEAKTTGHYRVSVTDANSCSATDDIRVNFLASPQKILPKTSTECKQVILNAGNPGATFDWSNLEYTQTIVANQTGIYTVKITNSSNCFVYDTASVTILAAATINLGDDISICDGQFVTLNAGDNGSQYTYTWNGQASNKSTYRVDKSGRYIVHALNTSNNCSVSDTINVYYKASPVVNLGNNRMFCNSNSVILDAQNTGALIQWGSSTGFVSTQQIIDVTTPGTYWTTVMNANGCLGSDTITIYKSAGDMVAEFIAASTVRAGDTVRFVNVSYPEPYTCSWFFGDGVTSKGNSPSHVFYFSEVFNVRLTISNEYCSAIVIKPITVQRLKSTLINLGGNGSDQFVEILASNLFPNPATDNITLQLTLSQPVDVIVAMYDINGKLLYLEKLKNTAEILKEYSLTHLQPGIYILKAGSGSVSKSFKIVKN